jgi:hypothetical protein
MDLSFVVASSLPGAAGGAAWFLYALKRGHYANNRFPRKAAIEIVGGIIVATVCAPSIRPFIAPSSLSLASFALGIAWSEIVQKFRDWITNQFK